MTTQTVPDAADSDAFVGRRERKKRETYLALHDAALALAEERGFEHLTVEAICEQADVSVRTFFNYFPCKEDAVLGGTDGFAKILDAIRARPADEAPLEAIRNSYLEAVRGLGDRAGAIRARYQLIQQYDVLRTREAGRMAAFEASIAAVLAERTGLDATRDAYPALVAAVGISVLRASFFRWQDPATKESLPTLVERSFDAVIAGLPVPPASKRPRKHTS